MLIFHCPVNIIGCAHHDSKNKKERRHIVDWLDSLDEDGEIVIFNGDTFDGWRERNFLKIVQEHIAFINRITGRGVDFNIYFLMIGNHDEHLKGLSVLVPSLGAYINSRLIFLNPATESFM